jgi:hypothetical protein
MNADYNNVSHERAHHQLQPDSTTHNTASTCQHKLDFTVAISIMVYWPRTSNGGNFLDEFLLSGCSRGCLAFLALQTGLLRKKQFPAGTKSIPPHFLTE